MGSVEVFGLVLEDIVAASLLMEAALAVLFAAALALAALHKGAYHHWIMLSGFLLDELVAKPIMVQRFTLGVFGDFPFAIGSGLPHIALSIVATVAGVLTIYLGFRFRVTKGRKMFLPPKGRLHKVSGAVFFVSWYATFFLGMRIFLQFYG